MFKRIVFLIKSAKSAKIVPLTILESETVKRALFLNWTTIVQPSVDFKIIFLPLPEMLRIRICVLKLLLNLENNKLDH